MNNLYRLFISASFCMSTIFCTQAQSGSCGTEMTWILADNVMTISGSGDMNIGATASYDIYKDQVKSIVFEEGVTSIANAAFANFTSLENVKFPSTLISINAQAFSHCTSLQEIELPESLQKIGSQAFDCCDLHSLTVPSNVIEVGARAFVSNRYLDEVIWNCNIPRETYQEEIFSYNQRYFFSDSGVQKVVFGAGVREIPDQLFFNTSLNEVEILGTIEYVGGNAFKDTPWMEARATEPIYVGKCLYFWPSDLNAPTKIDVPEGIMGISPCVFADQKYITEITLPSTLEYMGSCVFANCVSLVKVNYNAANLTAVTQRYYAGQYHNLLGPALSEMIVGPTVKSLPKQLCMGQDGLKEIMLPEVEFIGYECFRDCIGLVKVEMDKVKDIDDYAFYAAGVQSLSLPSSLEHIGFRAFGDIPDQTNIVFGSNLKSIDKDIFAGVTIENLHMNTSLPEMESGKGYMSAQVNHLVIGDDVTIMPPMILIDGTISGGNYRCKTLTVGRSVASNYSWNSAFKTDTLYWNAIEAEQCTSGKYYVEGCSKVVVGDGVRFIPFHMISASLVEEITFPEGLETIEGTILYSSKIKELTLPKSLKIIGKAAFSYCRDLEKINVYWEDPRVVETASDAFYEIDKEAVLFVPKGTEKLYASVSPWSQFINIGSDPDTWEKPQCDAPTVTFEDGKLRFTSDVDGAVYHYSITDSDIKSGTSDDGRIDLTATYEISVYSEAPGHIDSDTTYATLCFLERGEDTGVGEIYADKRGVAVCVSGHDIIVSGLNENEEVSVYDISGILLSSGKAKEGKIHFRDVEVSGNIVIIKFNRESIKVTMK